MPWETLFVNGIAFAIGAIPTGLPMVVTYLLAMGAIALAEAGAIMKRLRSVETLGSTTAANSDKTGTLTLNQMTATELVLPGRRFAITGEGYSTSGQITGLGDTNPMDLTPYLLPMALASDAVAKQGELVGDPTEGALVVLASKGGVDPVTVREAVPAAGRTAVRLRLQADGDLPPDEGRGRPRGRPLHREGRPRPAAWPVRLRARPPISSRSTSAPCAWSSRRRTSASASRACGSWPSLAGTWTPRRSIRPAICWRW